MDARRAKATSSDDPTAALACEPLLRPDDVARILNIGKRTFERWLSSGRFPRPDIKVGPKISLWKPATVRAWIEAESEANAQST
jgi:predicted DNA-binding transcriptional regulator AlpA